MDPLPQESENLPSEIPKKNFSKKRKPMGTFIKPAHRIIFQNYKDNGFRSLQKAVRQTGVYSEATATNVTTITKSKSWQALMDLMMPEEHLAFRHSELLNKREVRVIQNKNGEDIEVDNGPDTAAVTKGLELAYKLRGSFKAEEKPPASTVMYNLFYKPEVREQMKRFEDGLKQTLLNEINKRNVEELEAEEENKSNLQHGGDEEIKGSVEDVTDSGDGSVREGGDSERSVPLGDDGGGVPEV